MGDVGPAQAIGPADQARQRGSGTGDQQRCDNGGDTGDLAKRALFRAIHRSTAADQSDLAAEQDEELPQTDQHRAMPCEGVVGFGEFPCHAFGRGSRLDHGRAALIGTAKESDSFFLISFFINSA